MTTASQKDGIFLEAAWRIGIDLIRTSIWHQQKACSWIGSWIDVVDGQYKSVSRSFGPDFYSGTSGIVRFLGHLYAETQDSLLKKTVEGTVEQIKATMHTASCYGFYSGKAGIAACLIDVGNILQREDWIQEGLKLLSSIQTTPIADHEVDIISGVAGTIPILLDTYGRFGVHEYLEKAIFFGNMLLSKAQRHSGGASWVTVPARKNLTGFSHGVSGIAYSLLKLYTTTKNEDLLETVKQGFHYERLQFNEQQQNWPDYRTGAEGDINCEPQCGNAWCHGAPGIALSRMKANAIFPSCETAEMNIALTTTEKQVRNNIATDFSNTNFSLCHGVAGNVDILLENGQLELAETVGIKGIELYMKKDIPWPTGINMQTYTPGMMMGAAGTGYFFLRLHNSLSHNTFLLPH